MSTVETLNNSKIFSIFYHVLAIFYFSLILTYFVSSQFRGLEMVIMVIGLYLLRHSKLFSTHPKHHLLAGILPLIEFIFLILLFLPSKSGVEMFVIDLFIINLLLNYRPWYAFSFAYGGYLIINLLYPNGQTLLQSVFTFLNYSCVMISVWSVKQLLNQKEMGQRLNKALVQEAKMKEEVAALRERNRIAEEVHDTVGHTLTTAIVALEGAELLFAQNPEAACQKMKGAREQMKQGLGDIRYVVKELKAKDRSLSTLSLKERLHNMLTDTTRQTSVHFIFNYEVTSPLLSLQEYVIINAIKESITNAIKHGHPNTIRVTVMEQQDIIQLTVSDNGRGSEAVTFGFGLTTMEQRITAIGGQLQIQSEPMNGFTLHIEMPLAREGLHGAGAQNKSYVSG
ncbi:sensor histidine kinase [Paenibacillus sp. GCM10027627]